MDSLIKKINFSTNNPDLPTLEMVEKETTINANLQQGVDYVGNSAIPKADYSSGDKFAFIFRVDESVLTKYRMFSSGGMPMQGASVYYLPNILYRVSASEMNSHFFDATNFGPLANDPAPIGTGSGVFEFYKLE